MKELTKRPVEEGAVPDIRNIEVVERLVSDGDWKEAFFYACKASNSTTREVREYKDPISLVRDVLAHDIGFNDGDNWIGLFLMVGGEFLFLKAGCDSSGWDCQADGSAEWDTSLPQLWASLSEDERTRLGGVCPAREDAS